MAKWNVIVDFRLNETRNYPLDEIKHNDLISKKHKKVCSELLWTFSFFVSTISGCVLISAFASLVDVPVGIVSSVVGLKIFAITAGIKKYKSIIKKKRKKHDKIVLLAKPKLS